MSPGVSKGRGFAGGVKRWHYAGGDATHGRCFIGAWQHRRQFVSVARVEETSTSRGTHGQRQGHREEPER